MKAAVIHQTGGPEVISIEDAPDPTPGPTDVVIKVAACGLCGHDQADRQGLTHVDKPIILGHEISGAVVAAGSKVHAFKEGDRVASKQFTTCGWCEKCRGGRDTVALHPVCHRTIHEQASNVELARLADIEALRDRPEVARFLAWIAGKDPDFHVPTRRKRS